MEYIIFVAFPFVFLGIGVYVLYSNINKTKIWKKTKGEVVDHHWYSKRDSEGHVSRLANEIITFNIGGKNMKQKVLIVLLIPLTLEQFLIFIIIPKIQMRF